MTKALFHIVIICYMAAVVFVSIIKVQTPAPPIPYEDKLYHFATYAVMGSLWARFFRLRRKESGVAGRDGGADGSARVIVIASAAAFSFGLLMEVLQFFFPEREPELMDLVSNGLGGVTGAVIYERLLRRFRKRSDEGGGYDA